MSEQRSSILWVAAGAALWGTDTILRRPLSASMTPAQLVLWEHMIAGSILLPLLWLRREQLKSLSGREWLAVVGIAWGGSALASICFTYAVQQGHPTSAVLLQKTQPLFATALARLALHEIPARRFWICLAGGLAGAYLVSFGFRLPEAAPGRGAAAAALTAAALWGCSTVLGRFVLRRVRFLTLTALRLTVALPALAIAAGAPPLPSGGHAASYLVLLALVPGLLALAAYYRGLSRVPATLASVAELAFPATAALLNWIAFSAPMSAAQLCGFGLLWVSVWALDNS